MPVASVDLWTDPEALGMTLLILLMDGFGAEALAWEPETIEIELNQNGFDVSDENFDRLMTAISILTSNSFLQSPTDFSRACVVLSGHHVDQQSLILPDAADIAWGVTEGLLICPPDEDDENPFSKEITALIGHVLDSEGIINPPDVLRIATRDEPPHDYSFSDDPEMFASIQKFEQDKTDSINGLIRNRLQLLLDQLEKLPLQNGTTTAVVARLRKNLLSRSAR